LIWAISSAGVGNFLAVPIEPSDPLIVQEGAVEGGSAGDGCVAGLAKLNAASPATDANNATVVHLFMLDSLAWWCSLNTIRF